MQLFKRQKTFLLLLCLSLLTGCRTFDDFYNDAVGQPISHLENMADAPTPTKEQVANGNTVYAFRLKYQKDCTVFFEVDNQGIIVSWWHKGVCLAHVFGIN